MAERRMFAKTIIDSDAFIDMPITSRLLYYDLSMRADDEGFVNSPKKIMKFVGASDDDMKILIMKEFIIPFESGIVVIKDWKIHNYIQKDRFSPTKHINEKATLSIDENKAYTQNKIECIQNGYNMDTQVRLGKVRLGKDSIDILPQADKKSKKKYGEYKNVLLTDDELQKLKERFTNWEAQIKKLDEGIEMHGYKYKNHLLTMTRWAEKDKPKGQNKNERKAQYGTIL